jgi:hypothetical protein
MSRTYGPTKLKSEFKKTVHSRTVFFMPVDDNILLELQANSLKNFVILNEVYGLFF